MQQARWYYNTLGLKSRAVQPYSLYCLHRTHEYVFMWATNNINKPDMRGSFFLLLIGDILIFIS